MCVSCICLLAMHTLISVTFLLPVGVRGWLRLLLVALPGLFCLPFCETWGGDKNRDQHQGHETKIRDRILSAGYWYQTSLLYKLDYYGIRGHTRRWIACGCLGAHKNKFRRPSLRSSPRQVRSLERSFFLSFTDDLLGNIRSSVRHCADDFVLYRNILSSADCEILEEDLNSLARWDADWQMKFNVAKCHSNRVILHLPDKQIIFNCTLQNQILKQD